MLFVASWGVRNDACDASDSFSLFIDGGSEKAKKQKKIKRHWRHSRHHAMAGVADPSQITTKASRCLQLALNVGYCHDYNGLVFLLRCRPKLILGATFAERAR